LHYLPDNVRVIKNNLIAPPEIFTRIQEAVNTDWKEMYKVFNVGQRLEFYTDKGSAEEIIGLAKELGLDAQVSGHVEAAEKKSLLIESEYGSFEYS
jgi:phosphoribosylformylglycinamidine cyclo-ligase